MPPTSCLPNTLVALVTDDNLSIFELTQPKGVPPSLDDTPFLTGALFQKERRLRQVHLCRHGLHPLVVPVVGQKADSGGIARKRLVCERIDLDDGCRHRIGLIT